MLNSSTQKNDIGANGGGINVTECKDLADALRGEEGRFVAAMPDGTALIVDAQAGHSIASLKILPKSSDAANFTVTKVAHFQPEAEQGRGAPRTAVASN
jgi:hypothetical protein